MFRLLHNNSSKTWDVGVDLTCPGAREEHHQGFVLETHIIITKLSSEF